MSATETETGNVKYRFPWRVKEGGRPRTAKDFKMEIG